MNDQHFFYTQYRKRIWGNKTLINTRSDLITTGCTNFLCCPTPIFFKKKLFLLTSQVHSPMRAIFATPLHCGKWQMTLWYFLIVFPHFAHWNNILPWYLFKWSVSPSTWCVWFPQHRHDGLLSSTFPAGVLWCQICAVFTRVGEVGNRECSCSSLLLSLTMAGVSSHGTFRGGNLMYLGTPDQALPPDGRLNTSPEQHLQCYRTPISSKLFCLPPVHCGLWSRVARMPFQSEGLVCVALNVYISLSIGPFCQLWSNQSGSVRVV